MKDHKRFWPLVFLLKVNHVNLTFLKIHKFPVGDSINRNIVTIKWAYITNKIKFSKKRVPEIFQKLKLIK